MGRDARSLTTTGPWRAATVGIVALATLAAPQPAVAQERGRSPSAKELWDTYPLHPDEATGETTGEAPSSGTPVTAAEDRPSTPVSVPSSAGADGGDVPFALLVPMAAAAGAGLLLWTRRRRVVAANGAPEPEAAPAAPRPRAPARLLVPMAAATSGDPEPRGPPGPSSAAPPDPARKWTAEVEWAEAEGGAAFRVVARDADGAIESTVAESATFAWPPADGGAVQALTAAAEKLEALLLAAGWAPMAPGEAWYAKRFAWTAAQPAPDPVAAPAGPGTAAEPELRPVLEPAAAPAPMPRRPESVPPDTDWWCQIEWRTAVVNSRFHVVVHGPDGRRGTTVASSHRKWFLMSEPDPVLPDVRTELRHLADAVERAGWEPAGSGRHWYAERFAWRRAEPPPDRLDLSSR